MWHLTACKISVSLLFLNWTKNEMTFYRIQGYDKKSFHFKNERLTEILQVVRCQGSTLYKHSHVAYQIEDNVEQNTGRGDSGGH